MAIYQWLAEQGQFDRLLGIRSSFLEDFLVRGTKKQVGVCRQCPPQYVP